MEYSWIVFIGMVIKSCILVIGSIMLLECFCMRHNIKEYTRNKYAFARNVNKLKTLKRDLLKGRGVDDKVDKYCLKIYKSILKSEVYILDESYHSLISEYGKGCQSFKKKTVKALKKNGQNVTRRECVYFIEQSIYILQQTVIPTYEEKIGHMRTDLESIKERLTALSFIIGIIGLCRA